MWLDTRDVSSWDRNPANFMTVGYLTLGYHHSQLKRRNFHVYIYKYTLSATGVLKPWEELCIYVYMAVGNFPLECSPLWWEYIYCHPLTDGFIISQLISMATHAKCFKLGYIYHHHHVAPPARISLTVSRHFSLSFIASGRSSGLHPVSSHSCCM